jgi:carbon storage regulator
MLVLSRKLNEAATIGQDIEVVVLEIHGDRVKLGFKAPPEVPIHRREVHERINHSPPALEHSECA